MVNAVFSQICKHNCDAAKRCLEKSRESRRFLKVANAVFHTYANILYLNCDAAKRLQKGREGMYPMPHDTVDFKCTIIYKKEQLTGALLRHAQVYNIQQKWPTASTPPKTFRVRLHVHGTHQVAST